MSKPTITRVGDKIVRIRFKIQDGSAILQHADIVNQLPRDNARSEWIKKAKKFDIVGGYVEVTVR